MEWSKGAESWQAKFWSTFPPAHTHQTSGCCWPQLPASSDEESAPQVLKHGRKRTSKPLGNRPLPAGPQVALLSTLEEHQFPSEGNQGAPLGTPASQVRDAGSERGGAAPHDRRPGVLLCSLGFHGVGGLPPAPTLALQGAWESRLVGGNHSILKTLVVGRWEF